MDTLDFKNNNEINYINVD